MTAVFSSRFEKCGVELNENLAPHVGLEPPIPPSLSERSTTSTTTTLSGGPPTLGYTLGGQHYSTADSIAGQSFPLAVTVLPGLRKPGHVSALTRGAQRQWTAYASLAPGGVVTWLGSEC